MTLVPHRSKVESAILVTLYKALVEEDDPRQTIQGIQSRINTPLSGAYLKLAVTSLVDNGVVLETGRAAPIYFSIANPGVDFIQQQENNPNSDVALYMEMGAEWLVNDVELEGDDVVPASDRIVTLMHNQQYEELVESIDSVVSAFTEYKDQRPNSLDDETVTVFSELEAGRAILNAPQVKESLAKQLLFDTLKYIADRSLSALIGAAAVTALGLVAAYFGFIA